MLKIHTYFFYFWGSCVIPDHEAHTSFALRRACRGVKGKEKGKGRQGGVGIPPVQRERVGVRRPRSAAPVWVSEKLVKWLPVVVPGVGLWVLGDKAL